MLSARFGLLGGIPALSPVPSIPSAPGHVTPPPSGSGGFLLSGWFWLLLFLLVVAAVVGWLALYPPMAADARIELDEYPLAAVPLRTRARGVRLLLPESGASAGPDAAARGWMFLWIISRRRNGSRADHVWVVMLIVGRGTAWSADHCTIRRGRSGFLAGSRVLVEVVPAG